jgi:hypothetical protein
MNNTVKILDCDVIFLSYDEPNAEKNYSKLLEYVPWAQRTHGVKGSDAAHKACARLASTERVVIVDGDNYMVRDNFLKQTVEVLDSSVDLSQSVISWPSVNIINGLIYGNGGIKCWPTEKLLSMRTHESADPNNIRAQVDFCWDINYIPLDETFTEIHNNSTYYQAWRAGFREGVKMSLDQGYKVDNFSKLWKGNVNRLATWMMVGSDVANGLWSIYGARLGCWMTQFTDWDYTQVRDFDYLEHLWTSEVSSLSESEIKNKSNELTDILKTQISIGQYLEPDQSVFFKQFSFNSKRQSNLITVHYE